MKSLQIEVNGRTIIGRYRSVGGIVTVFYEGREKSTQAGGLSDETVAKLLLRELAS